MLTGASAVCVDERGHALLVKQTSGQRLDEAAILRPDRKDISSCGYWALDALPRPISDFTIRRINDALSEKPVRAIVAVPPRQWFD